MVSVTALPPCSPRQQVACMHESWLLNFGTRFRLGTAAGDRGGSLVSTCTPVGPPATELPAPVQGEGSFLPKRSVSGFQHSVFGLVFTN